MSHPAILDDKDTLLLVVDIQDAFLKTIWEAGRVVANSVSLINAARVLDIPILVTLQNAERLGACTGPVSEALPHQRTINKMTFSCAGEPRFVEALESAGRGTVLMCGIETHVCISQTAHDLLALNYRVHVAKDAVSSRTEQNWVTGIEKMRDSGCVITSTEAAILELTRDASRPEFKQILQIVK